jgi:DNA-binding PadR family transcriptional regulator
LNQVTEILIQRLEKKGIAPTVITGFLRSVMITISDNAPMSLQEMNKRLHALGWDSFEMDDNTLQLIIASLEAEGLIGAGNKAVQLFKEKYE